MKKLVRDNIPDMILSRWEKCEYYIANEVEYIKYLFEKIIEEANEVANTKTDDNLKEEIADLYEVIDSIIINKNFSKEKILEIQKQKKEQRWWFVKKIILTKY